MRGLTFATNVPVDVAGNGDIDYLLTPDPKEVWQAANPVSTIDIDLGEVRSIDTIFLGFTNASATTTWRADATTSMAGANPSPIFNAIALRVPGAGPRYHGLQLLAAAIQTRYLRITITHDAAGFQAGCIMVDERIEHPYEFKSGRRPIDLAERVELSGGGFGTGDGAVKSGFRFTVAGLDDDELLELYRSIMAIGLKKPALAVEGGEAVIVHEQVHYCVFERFEAYEREDSADTRWGLSIVDWV